MKKLFIVFWALLFGLMPVAQAETMRSTMMETLLSMEQQFPDLHKQHSNFPAVAYLTEREVIAGYPDGTFKPDGQINRAELVKMVVGMMDGTPATSFGNCFPDVHTEWYAGYICYAKEKGWIAGYPDGTFKPANPVSRVEAIKIILNALIEDQFWPTPTNTDTTIKTPKDADMKQWYGMYLGFGLAKELLDGQHVTEANDGSYAYGPGAPMTRKEVAEMIFRTYLYMVERIETAELLAGTICFQELHTGLPEEEAKAIWLRDYLSPAGYTEAEADDLVIRYGEDSVVDELTADLAGEECKGMTPDMTKWQGLARFGM